MRNMSLKTIAWFLLTLVICIVLLSIVNNELDRKRINEIQKQYDTRLDVYIRNKEIALSYLQVLTITDNNSYKLVKEKIYSNLGGALQTKLFPTDDYTGDDRPSISYKVVDTKVEKLESDFIYKVEYEVWNDGFNKNFITLITVRDGKILGVETI